jgi:hypothetical protein
MRLASDIPEYAAAAVRRASPTGIAIIVTLALAATALVATWRSDLPRHAAPEPTINYESNLCEPDGTFCEPAYLRPPRDDDRHGDGTPRLSARQAPSG